MNKPLIIFPKPSEILPRTLSTPRSFPTFFGPDKGSQEHRFEKRITALDTAISNERITLSQSVAGFEPERLLVFEIKGEIEDFYKAVERTMGMEFIAEKYLGEEDPDESFIYRRYDSFNNIIDDPRKVAKRLFLTINNKKALDELKGYWDNYKKNKKFDRGTTKFRDLFAQLNDIRYYSVEDRYQDTGIIEYFKERLDLKEEILKFEIELTYRNNAAYLKGVYSHIKNLVEASNGKIYESSYIVIDEIKYHALIAEVPIGLFNELKEDTSVAFFKCDQILFFRPVGQSIFNEHTTDQAFFNIKPWIELIESNKLKEDPIVALIDGLPIQNHALLSDNIIVDDPEGLESAAPSKSRFHGTAMASLILWGDLNNDSINLIERKLHIYPILIPKLNPITGIYEEVIPENKLFIDIIHRAVRRMMDGEGDEKPTSPNIKIINLSIGDINRPFLFNNSSWARLIDWLSFKYNLLFIISSGNYNDDIQLDLNSQQFNSLDPIQKEGAFLSSLVRDNYKRKILAPAESINAITVGAYYFDEYKNTYITNNYRVELLSNQLQISPISRIGMGYLNSIKPDILFQGGRQLYRVKSTTPNRFGIDPVDLAPGHRVAYPDSANTNQGSHFTRGTSNSAALATRFAAHISEVLENLSFETLTIPQDYYPVIIKALLVHGATNDNMAQFYTVLGDTNKTKLLPYVGHGFVLNENKVLTCTEQQVTLIGFGDLKAEQSHIYELPLPNEISSQQVIKQLTITLAWISPINFMSNKYKKAALYIDNIAGSNSTEDDIDWDNNLYNYFASKRGTVQHLRYVGTGADAYIENSTLKIKINCRENAVNLTEIVKYGLAVTFELLNNTSINIYTEIRQRIAQKITIR